ncbi:pyridoxal phosphate-dependent decarboxylase family protein [Streptomyces sp. NPDC093600]|uniref:pyridoxal phosphate-dependent decarboxylase family protein n=1 Tax=Streptomyces sp. NPDC093600 TaxID=3366047 RepID=UPI00382DFD44
MTLLRSTGGTGGAPDSRQPRGIETAVAGGHEGPHVLRSLTWTVLGALAEGATARSGPLPAGGPDAVADAMAAACGPVLPEEGIGAEAALGGLVRAVAAGAADPSDPSCVAHLHCPPLAVAVAADLAASALNPSMDSWDQAPAAAVIEQRTTEALAALVYPGAPAPDALITSGGTESNLVALLLARERARALGARPLQVLTGANAHHSVHRAAWMLGLPTPVVVECRAGRMVPAALDRALTELGRGPALVVATAGTTDEGLIDPLPELSQVAACHGAELHVDAAYGGPLLFSDRLAPRLAGLGAAVSVTFDLHKLGWQPVAAGVLAVADTAALDALSLRADYLNADDDTEAGLPDLLGRSIRTSRRPDALKIAATLQSLGRQGIGALVEHCVRTAEEFAAAVDAHPALRRRPGDIGISTVLFRPTAADALPDDEGDALVAAVRRDLLAAGRAVLGRARAADADGTPRLWLKATLLHPRSRAADLAGLLELVTETAGHHRHTTADASGTDAHRPHTPTQTEPQAETETETAAAAGATGSGTVTLAADARPTGGPR